MTNSFSHWQRIPHALLVQTQPCCALEQFLTDYVLRIAELLDINDPDTKQKIQNRTYFDWLTVDGTQQIIKKDDILNVMTRFQTYGAEKAKMKICVLRNFNQANEAAYNAFLRFLEEPTPNTFFVLTTTEIGTLPKTIVSRCERIILPSAKEKLPAEYQWMAPAFATLQDWQRFQSQADFVEIVTWINDFQNKQTFVSLLEQFKKWDYGKIKQVCALLSQIGTLSFREAMQTLTPVLVANPTKTLLFFTIWEAWTNAANLCSINSPDE